MSTQTEQLLWRRLREALWDLTWFHIGHRRLRLFRIVEIKFVPDFLDFLLR